MRRNARTTNVTAATGNSGAGCDCGCKGAAVANYSGRNVCDATYRALAAIDDSPNRIPSDHDWAAEQASRPVR